MNGNYVSGFDYLFRSQRKEIDNASDFDNNGGYVLREGDWKIEGEERK